MFKYFRDLELDSAIDNWFVQINLVDLIIFHKPQNTEKDLDEITEEEIYTDSSAFLKVNRHFFVFGQTSYMWPSYVSIDVGS